MQALENTIDAETSRKSQTGTNDSSNETKLDQDAFVYVVTRGRITKRKHVIKLKFVRLENDLVSVLVNLRDGTPDWIQNILWTNNSESNIASRRFYGRIRSIEQINYLTSGDLKDRIIQLFKLKYDYGKETGGERDFENLSMFVIRYESLEWKARIVSQMEFDFQARNYTSYIFANEISKWMREVTLSILSKYFKRGDTVLEIGCGTGIETVELAKRGIQVVAVDISEEMLSRLDSRASKEGVANLIHSHQLDVSEISRLRSEGLCPPEGFDGIFSTFGALNLEPNLFKLSNNLRSLTKDQGYGIFGVWNKYCLIDALGQILQRNVGFLSERFSGRVRAGSDSPYSLDTFTYTPAQFSAGFASDFDLISFCALPTFLPPYRYNRRAGPFIRFRNADLAIGRLPIFRNLGDNFVMTMRARGNI